MRALLPSVIVDAPNNGDLDVAPLGRRVILPSSYVGGDRFISQCYQDSMAVLRALGNPDLFITVTANPSWPEITRELLPGQTANDRPDIVSRVFKLKTKAILAELKAGIFREYAGMV